MRQPRVLPRRLLDQPALAQALARRDFSAVFTAAHQAGLTYAEIGDAVGLKPSRVSLIAHGRQQVTAIDTVERIADGLHLPGVMLGLAARPWEQAGPAASGKEDPVDRRGFLRGILAAGAAGTGIAEVLADTNAALAYTGPGELTSIEAAAEQYARGYRGRAPAVVLDELVAEVAAAAPLLRLHQKRADRITLARAVGQLSACTAIVLHDLGRHRDAHAWFAGAARAAAQSGDRQLHAWTTARRAMVPLNFGAPLVAARLAEEARHLAGQANTPAAALAASVAARAHAVSGHHDNAVTALADADRIAGKLTTTQSADTWTGYGAQKHHVHRSQALTLLGDTTAARTAQQTALDLTGPTSTMTRTLLLLDAAACDNRDGDPHGACQAAVTALTTSSGRYREGLVRQRGLDLYQHLPDDARHTTAAAELAEILAAGR